MSPTHTSATSSADITTTIIAQERAALVRWCAGDPSGFLDISAADVVYFDPLLAERLDGLDALTQYYESIRGQVHVEWFDLLNPHVHVCGDAAVLTFNYVSRDRAGTESRWNCTEVYRLDPAGWRIIQTHWSLTKALGHTQ